jgi:demethylmenaquinone methyltransferase/2-methoxy-6-polyprenyl-1,4-benzoquinol methylase
VEGNEISSCGTINEPMGRAHVGRNALAHHWVDCERAFIAQRYDRIAGLIGLFDWLFFFPPHLRARAAARLDAEPGDRVLEIGCGTGRNFPHLRAAVGPTGKVYGVDLSAGMLRKARELCEREQWTNVEVTHCDALEYIPPEPLDGILFGLSYNTMPHHLAVLRHAWKQLRPGGRIVILDGKLPHGLGGKLVLPFGLWLMKRTMLGNPFIKPWNDLAALVSEANGQRGHSISARAGHSPEAGSSALAALVSEANGQRGAPSIVRAHSAAEDARERANDTRPEAGSSARAALADEFAMEEYLFGSWYVCWGTKPVHAQTGEAVEQLMAAE